IERNNMITNDAQTTEAANKDEMLATNKFVGHLNRLIQPSLVSSSNNVLEIEMLHDNIKDFISVMDTNSGSRIQRRYHKALSHRQAELPEKTNDHVEA
ncbi:hypothetical protein CU098_008123, partial [Rhizopus stolonifer]